MDTRARLLPLDATLERTFDRYAFIRDAFLQRRLYQVFDGNPPEQPIEDEFGEEFDENLPEPGDDGTDGTEPAPQDEATTDEVINGGRD